MKNAVKQNWQKATKKRILFKLGETLVGDIDLVQESNNNNDNNNSIQPEDCNHIPMLDEQDRELRKLADHAASVKFDDEDDWIPFFVFCIIGWSSFPGKNIFACIEEKRLLSNINRCTINMLFRALKNTSSVHLPILLRLDFQFVQSDSKRWK